MPPFRRASAFLCYIGKKNNPSVFRRKIIAIALSFLSAMRSYLSKFRISEKKVENIFSRTIAFGRYPFSSVSYVLEISKSKNFLDSSTNLFGESTPFRQLCIRNGRNGHFWCFQINYFVRLIATGEAGILLPSYLSLDNCCPASRKNSWVCSPSISYAFLIFQIPNFREYSR